MNEINASCPCDPCSDVRDAAMFLDRPYLAEPSDIVKAAASKGVQLALSDVKGPSGDYIIDGIEWWAWLEAMTRD